MARDAELETAATSAIADVIQNWRQSALGTAVVGSSAVITGPGGGRTTVTRIGPQLFWIVAEVTRIDGAQRRQNLIVRLRTPVLDSLPAMTVSGDASITSGLSIVADSSTGCAASGPDLVAGNSTRLTALDGPLPPMQIARVSSADSSNALAWKAIDSLAARPDLELPGATSSPVPSGVVHVAGDLTLTGGSGAGILVIDGTLQVAGPIHYAGVIIGRGGVRITADGSSIEGAVRTPGGENRLDILGATTLRRSRCSLQVVVSKLVRPSLIAGRRWAEMY
jgi:hypothetical protein